MAEDDLKKSIQKEEGLRLKAYRDIFGNWTIGYGHLINEDFTITQEMADNLFNQDYAQACSDYIKLNLSLDPVRRSVVIDLLFNLGYSRLLKFQKFIMALRNNDWDKAAYELKTSKYASQLPERANRNINKIKTGKL